MSRAVARKGQIQPNVPRPVRLMIIDDSLVARTALKRMIGDEAGMEIVASVNTAEAALAVLGSVQVDVLLLDLEMPGMGGLTAIPKIVAAAPHTRILVVSSLTVDGAEQTLKALSLGAAGALPKPNAVSFTNGYRQTLIERIRALGIAAANEAGKPAKPAAASTVARRFPIKAAHVLAIGASTGGIHALMRFFGSLTGRVNVPILVTQHLPGAFMDAFARQLTIASGYEAIIADEDMPLLPGRIHIAPGEAHMTVRSLAGRPVVRLEDHPVQSGCRPSVDPMFASLAREFGENTLGIVLSGMGRDGAEGAARIVKAGGTILAQDEDSSAVWGMPRAVAEAGLASAILPPEEIAVRISASLGFRHGNE